MMHLNYTNINSQIGEGYFSYYNASKEEHPKIVLFSIGATEECIDI